MDSSFISPFLIRVMTVVGVVILIIIAFIVVLGRRPRSISYEEIMKYLISHKNSSSNIVNGAIMREKKPYGYKVTVTFLDRNGQPVLTSDKGENLGYTVKVSGFDKELENAFKNNNLIIIE